MFNPVVQTQKTVNTHTFRIKDITGKRYSAPFNNNVCLTMKVFNVYKVVKVNQPHFPTKPLNTCQRSRCRTSLWKVGRGGGHTVIPTALYQYNPLFRELGTIIKVILMKHSPRQVLQWYIKNVHTKVEWHERVGYAFPFSSENRKFSFVPKKKKKKGKTQITQTYEVFSDLLCWYFIRTCTVQKNKITIIERNLGIENKKKTQKCQ